MEQKPDNNKPSKEIDIIGLLKSLWVERTLVIKVCFFSAILGVFMALNSPKIYTTSVVLAPESSDPSSSLSKLGSLTSMLGLKMGSTISSDAIFPELYPQVLASTDFQISLFDIPVRLLEDENTKTYYRHLIEDSFIPVWRWPQIWISSLFKKKTEPKPLNPFHLTKEQTNICGLMRKSINCVVDKKTGVITISVSDEDKYVSALMADTVTSKLQQYITLYRTKKTRHDLDYLHLLYKQSKEDYLQAQNEYAKATIFDYSYKWFYNDGYGKDYRILNLADDSIESTRKLYLTGCLLAFYQQYLVFETNKSIIKPFNLEKPLWIFVGGTVKAVRSISGRKVSRDL